MSSSIRLLSVGFLALGLGASAQAAAFQPVGSGFAKASPMAYSGDDYAHHSEALMNSAENALTNYFPEHATTLQLTDQAGYPILYRVYSNGWMAGTYWWGYGVPRIYYSPDGGAHWSYYGTIEDGNAALCGGQCWTPDMASEIEGVMSDVLNLTGDLTNGGLMQQFTVILRAVFSSSQSFCPMVASNPPLSSLSALPSTWDISVNYGSGCTAADGSNMSGSATVRMTNLQFVSSSFSTHVDATFNNLYRNGAPFANGNATGDIALTGSTGSLGGNANVHVSNFLMPNGQTASGDISIQPTGALGSFNATMNTATQISPLPGLYLDAGMQQLAVTVQKQSDSSELINGTGEIYGYAVQFANLLFNSNACQSFPIGGSVIFTKNGASATVTYNASCNGSYIYQQN